MQPSFSSSYHLPHPRLKCMQFRSGSFIRTSSDSTSAKNGIIKGANPAPTIFLAAADAAAPNPPTPTPPPKFPALPATPATPATPPTPADPPPIPAAPPTPPAPPPKLAFAFNAEDLSSSSDKSPRLAVATLKSIPLSTQTVTRITCAGNLWKWHHDFGIAGIEPQEANVRFLQADTFSLIRYLACADTCSLPHSL
jgi:hypothetical protein